MRGALVILAVAVVLVFAVDSSSETMPEGAPLTWEQAAVSDGETLFVRLCAVCHGTDAKGGGPAAEALAAPLSDLTMLTKANDGVFPMDEVEKAIRGDGSVVAHGTDEMPVWGRAFEDLRPDHKPGQRYAFAHVRVLNLAKYIESIQAQ